MSLKRDQGQWIMNFLSRLLVQLCHDEVLLLGRIAVRRLWLRPVPSLLALQKLEVMKVQQVYEGGRFLSIKAMVQHTDELFIAHRLSSLSCNFLKVL